MVRLIALYNDFYEGECHEIESLVYFSNQSPSHLKSTIGTHSVFRYLESCSPDNHLWFNGAEWDKSLAKFRFDFDQYQELATKFNF